MSNTNETFLPAPADVIEAIVYEINDGDTAWMLTSSALVMLMTPGLAFFYGGLVRSKNIINTMMMSFLTLGLVTVHWVVFGYSFSFGGGNVMYGSGDFVGLRGVGTEPNPIYAATIPHMLFCVYQMMFAIITPAIISGAVVERMSFRAYVLFILCWTTLVYDMIAHWVWAGWDFDSVTALPTKFGWLRGLGALDFAGGTVVHISSGVSALTAAFIVGRRPDIPRGDKNPPPSNIAYVMLGGSLLWFGWFGFNAGSALSSSALAAVAFINTQIATGSGFLAWVFLDLVFRKAATAVGAMSGAVVGLVAITPAAGYVHAPSSIFIGAVTVIIVYFAVRAKSKWAGRVFPQLDDSLDVFSCHGLGGILGCIWTGFFASTSVNPYGANGVFFGGGILLGYQFAAIAATVGISVVFTAIILLVIKYLIGLTVDDSKLEHGLDLSEHAVKRADLEEKPEVTVELDAVSQKVSATDTEEVIQ